MSTDKEPIPEWLKQQAASKAPEYLKDSDRNKGRFTWEQGYAAGAMDFMDTKPSQPSPEGKPAHPVYKGWDSLKLIGRVRERFKELIHKGWDWRSFYGGWLEGRAGMLQEMQKEWDAPQLSPGVRWVKAKERLPSDNRSYPVRWVSINGQKDNLLLTTCGRIEELLRHELDLEVEWLEETPAPPIDILRPACTCEHGPTDDNPTCSYPNCYPEGGGEGEKNDIEWLKQTIIKSLDNSGEPDAPFLNAGSKSYTRRELSSAIANGDEIAQNIVSNIIGLAVDLIARKKVNADLPEARIADDKEVPTKAQGVEMSFLDIVEEKRKVETKLFAARNEISTHGKQITKLLAELKEADEENEHNIKRALEMASERDTAQNDLTALIDEALQKSKRLDEVEKEMADYRLALNGIVGADNALAYLYDNGVMSGTAFLQAEHDLAMAKQAAQESIEKYPSPTQNPDK